MYTSNNNKFFYWGGGAISVFDKNPSVMKSYSNSLSFVLNAVETR